jgi:hypothetical protein
MDLIAPRKIRSKAIGKSYEYIEIIRDGDPEGLTGESISLSNQTSMNVELTGTYLSENTGTNNRKFLSNYTGGKVILIQKGNNISGTYHTTGKKAGRIKGDTINFNWST